MRFASGFKRPGEGGLLEVERDAACGERLRQRRRAAAIEAEDEIEVALRRGSGRQELFLHQRVHQGLEAGVVELPALLQLRQHGARRRGSGERREHRQRVFGQLVRSPATNAPDGEMRSTSASETT